ncbi:MAG: single-stranded DNA-binding protein [Mycoplasmataceae bacterium]|nr:single-stranded DNA-binding protein [Mycoplasmataceae bacterium]
MNSVTLAGRLSKEPETINGKYGPFVKITIASKVNKDKTDFIPCLVFNKTADYVNKYLHVGDFIHCQGYISITKTTKEQNHTIYATNIVIQNIVFVHLGQKSWEISQIQKIQNDPTISLEDKKSMLETNFKIFKWTKEDITKYTNSEYLEQESSSLNNLEAEEQLIDIDAIFKSEEDDVFIPEPLEKKFKAVIDELVALGYSNKDILYGINKLDEKQYAEKHTEFVVQDVILDVIENINNKGEEEEKDKDLKKEDGLVLN